LNQTPTLEKSIQITQLKNALLRDFVASWLKNQQACWVLEFET